MVRLLFPLFWLAFFLPKIDVVPAFGSAIRVSDLLLCVALVSLSMSGHASVPRDAGSRAYLFFSAYSFAVALANYAPLGLASSVFAVRVFEYFLWSVVGYNIARHVEPAKLLRWFGAGFCLLIVWSVAEYSGLVPKLGKFKAVGDRVTVNTSGPYEYAAVISLFLFLARSTKFRVAAFASLLLTKSRVTTLAAACVLFFRYKIMRAAMILAVVALVPILALSEVDVASGSRLDKLPSLDQLASVTATYYRAAPRIGSSEEYKARTHAGSGGLELANVTDVSLEMRLLRWFTAIKAMTSSWWAPLVGLGPGYFGVALDGQYVRLLVETGVVGVALFGLWVVRSMSLLSALRGPIPRAVTDYLAVLLGSGLLIDIFFAEKPMMVYWFLYGYVLSLARKSAEEV